MKIVFLNLYSGLNNRGAENFAHGLAQRLGERHQVMLISGANVTLPKVKAIVISAPMFQPTQGFVGPFLDLLGKRFFLDRANLSVLLFTLRSLPMLWREKFEVIIPLNGFWQVLICRTLTLFFGGKILITGHSGPGWDERWNLYLGPDVFVATTEPTAEWARKTAPWTKVVTIPYGVDLDEFSQARPVKLPLEKPVILCPAAAVEYKRVDLAIRAVALLRQGSLLHLGKGPLIGSISALGAKLLGPKRFATFSVESKLMPTYYKASDLVVLPSAAQENSPLVFLESLAAGKAILTTDTPRNRWILEEAGVFVNPEDVSSFAQAITRVLSHPKAREIIKNQAGRFDWNKIAKEYGKTIETI